MSKRFMRPRVRSQSLIHQSSNNPRAMRLQRPLQGIVEFLRQSPLGYTITFRYTYLRQKISRYTTPCLSRFEDTCLIREVRDFVFRGLLLESEAEVFRRAGINVGIDLQASEEQLLLEALSPFGVQRRNDALEMARLYAILHAFENELRALIRETLDQQVGTNWWDTESVPRKIKDTAETRQKAAQRDSWLEGAKADRLEYVDFGDLSSIIIQNWEHFQQIIPGQDWLRQRMTELEKTRNFIAHNRMLLPSEFQRIYMYVSDWNKGNRCECRTAVSVDGSPRVPCLASRIP
jgi:hypothetical protein